jgi:hypothetical protein
MKGKGGREMRWRMKNGKRKREGTKQRNDKFFLCVVGASQASTSLATEADRLIG